MAQPSRGVWWILLATALVIVVCWPPERDKSLAMKITNWAVDPSNVLPVLPAQLGYGASDDPQAVEARDAQVRHYDQLYSDGGWTRKRLELKVASDPFNRSTTRQLLLACGVIVAFAGWKRSR